MENTYVPYSIRHSVTSVEFAQLYDYIERVMGLDFDVITTPSLKIVTENGIEMEFEDKLQLVTIYSSKGFILSTVPSIFFRSFGTLFPLINSHIKSYEKTK